MKHIVWKDQNQTTSDTKQSANNQPAMPQGDTGVIGHLLNAGFVTLSPLDSDSGNCTDKQLNGSCESTTVHSFSSDSFDSVQSMPHSLPPPSPKRTLSLASHGVQAQTMTDTKAKTRSHSLTSCKSLQRKVSSMSYRRLCT